LDERALAAANENPALAACLSNKTSPTGVEKPNPLIFLANGRVKAGNKSKPGVVLNDETQRMRKSRE
jgi:hypothetical protein